MERVTVRGHWSRGPWRLHCTVRVSGRGNTTRVRPVRRAIGSSGRVRTGRSTGHWRDQLKAIGRMFGHGSSGRLCLIEIFREDGIKRRQIRQWHEFQKIKEVTSALTSSSHHTTCLMYTAHYRRPHTPTLTLTHTAQVLDFLTFSLFTVTWSHVQLENLQCCAIAWCYCPPCLWLRQRSVREKVESTVRPAVLPGSVYLGEEVYQTNYLPCSGSVPAVPQLDPRLDRTSWGAHSYPYLRRQQVFSYLLLKPVTGILTSGKMVSETSRLPYR